MSYHELRMSVQSLYLPICLCNLGNLCTVVTLAPLAGPLLSITTI